MSNRISEKFKQQKIENRGGFIPFIMAGDPNLRTTEQLILELARIGASVIELGIPFSDPVADGATIQRSGERSLKNRIGIKEVLELIARIRQKGCGAPIILFGYFNPILQFGLENFVRKAKEAGADGVLVTDLVPEEAEEFYKLLTTKNLSLITLAAPTSSDERLRKICEKASGFVYAVSRAGVTGARTDLSSDAESLVERLRKITDLPIAVGFGISTKEQVAEVWRYADAAVVGSAIVAEMMRLAPNQEEVAADFVEKIGHFTNSLLPI
ncbi:MAG: tryptophan synthase subunit alpha [Acidobacteriota bacterium]|nr:tryptophan synthase subunit alpha [Acidobacteriota bacterium]